MPKFLICKKCGNLVGMIHDSGVRPVCCGEEMHEIVANTVEASREKHLPVVHAEEHERAVRLTVNVGSVDHPMTEAHLINLVFVETEKGGQRHSFNAGDKPEAVFVVDKADKAVAVYAYCNLHGLWKTEL